MKLHAHSVQYAYQLVRRAFEKTFVNYHRQGQEWGTATFPPDLIPIDFLVLVSMVEGTYGPYAYGA